jgi:hypothetical protein
VLIDLGTLARGQRTVNVSRHPLGDSPTVLYPHLKPLLLDV